MYDRLSMYRLIYVFIHPDQVPAAVAVGSLLVVAYAHACI